MSHAKHSNPNDNERSTALLGKISATLDQTKPEQWKEFGAKFDSDLRPKKPVSQWEHFFVLEIKAGYLVLRSSLTVASQFQNGGYNMTPTALPLTVVELRDRTWDPKSFIAKLQQPKKEEMAKPEVLAQGATAEKLFEHIMRKVYTHVADQDRDFGVLARETIQALEDLLHAGINHSWDKSVEKAVTVYSANIETVRVEVARHTGKDGALTYRLRIKNAEGLSRIFDTDIAGRMFSALDDYDNHLGLSKLDDILTGTF